MVLSVLAFVGTFVEAQRAQRQPSPRYVGYAIPIALSELVYHKPHDYTAYYAVSRVLTSGSDAGHQSVDRLIRTARRLRDFDQQTLTFMPSDDKGLADFTLLAFRLFGARVHSLI